MPTLVVLALTDSMSAAWGPLASSADLALEVVASADALPSDAVAVLVAAAGAEDQLAPAAARLGTRAPIAAIGALADHRLAASVVRAGAHEYFALPGDLALLDGWVRECAVTYRQRAAGAAFAADPARAVALEGIRGSSASLAAAVARARRVMARGAVTVLLTGETGTGKELFARAIHAGSPRRAAPFVDVNCAAIPEHLLESELFGHEKGAFTGATGAKAGLFEVADGGTLFLDEIGHLPLVLQGKLLRALQDGVIRRVGGTRSSTVDVRIIAATHVDLPAAVRAGTFREDLYYRLAVVPIELPPLRDRDDDVLELAAHFLAQFADEYGLDDAHWTEDARRAIVAHRWPGNIRELRNAIERAVLLADGPALGPRDLFPEPTATPLPAAGGLPFPAPMDDIEHAAARAMVVLCDGNKSEAARRLRISRMRLQRLLDGAPGSPTDDSDDSTA